MEKAELIITALQQRIGDLVMQYEITIASLRADLTQLMEKNDIVTQDKRQGETN
jgi:hypothetical protein